MESHISDSADGSSGAESTPEPLIDAQSLPVTEHQFESFDSEAGSYRGPVPSTIDSAENEAEQSDDLTQWAQAQDEALVTAIAPTIPTSTAMSLNVATIVALVEARPLAALACAVAAGLLLDKLLPGRSGT